MRDKILSLGRGITNLHLLLVASLFIGIASGMHETTFNNFLDEVYQIEAAARGWLELPRELPGLLVAVFTGVLFFLRDTRMAAVAMVIMSLGLIGLASIPSAFGATVIWIVLMSIGMHIYQPLEQSIGVAVAEENMEATRLGQIMAARVAATVIGAGMVWVAFDYLDLFYNNTFLLAALSAAAAGLMLFFMGHKRALAEGEELEEERQEPRKRFLLKREFSLFYVLNFLFGARKQIFMTFAPWLLVRIFGQPPSIIARLWIVSSILGVFFRPLLGRVIDSMGERFVLLLDALLVFTICMGYGFAGDLNIGVWGLRLVYGCYVLDQMLMATNMARTTYVTKLASGRSELTPTLALGVSINHAVSMSIPILGGLIWTVFGYQWVFIMFAMIALANVFVASRIEVPTTNSLRGVNV